MVVNWNSGDDGPEGPRDSAMEALVNPGGDGELIGDAAMMLSLAGIQTQEQPSIAC
jgi:hypothetical protein